MAARKKPLHPNRIEEMREKIKTTLLVKRIEDHVFTSIDDPEFAKKVMSGDQVRAALGLLSKTLPNMAEVKQETEHSGAVSFGWLG